MASVVYGSLVTELRGSLGGQTFSKCKSGYIMYNKPIPSGLRSPATLAAQRAMFNVAASWRSLSAALVLAWSNVAATATFYNSLGNPYTPTGYQVFCWINDRLARANVPLITNPVSPVVQNLNVAQPTSIVFATNTLNFGFNPAGDPASRYFFYTYQPTNKGYQGSSPPWRLIALGQTFAQADTTIVPIMKSLYPTAFKVGNYVPFMQIAQNINSGVISRLGLPSLILIS